MLRARRCNIIRLVRSGDRYLARLGSANRGLRFRPGANHLHGLPVGQQGMVRGQQDFRHAHLHAGGMGSIEVPHADETLRLIECNPVRNPVREFVHHKGRVVGKPVGTVPVQPASPAVKGVGEIPVKQGHPGADAVFQQGINQPAVEIEALCVDGAGALRKHAWPADRESIGLQAHFGHQADIFPVAMVMVTGNVHRYRH